MKTKKKIWLFLLFSLCWIAYSGISKAEEFLLSGENAWLVAQPLTFEIISSEVQISSENPVFFHIQGQTIKSETPQMIHEFPATWTITLKAELKTGDDKLTAEKELKIFDKQILYIGEENESFNFGFEEQLNAAGYLLKKMSSSQAESEESNSAFLLSEIIIINEKNFQNYLEKYITIKKASPNPLSKKIILLTNAKQNLLKRSLAQYASTLETDELSIINPLHLMNLLSDLGLGKGYQEQGYATSFTRNNESWPKRMFLSYFVDELLKSGFPMQILGILLTLSVVALIISFLRQIVGLSVYGVYWPLLFALTGHLLGLQITLALLGIALFSNILMAILNKRMPLLNSSKVSLAISVFLVALLAGYTCMLKFWLPAFLSGNRELLMVFPVILMLIMSQKLFPSFKFWTKQRWIGIVEFLVIVGLSYGILQWQAVSDLLLSYPELLLVILIANIIIGRFSGLQLLELIRFMPLLKKNLDQEEEE